MDREHREVRLAVFPYSEWALRCLRVSQCLEGKRACPLPNFVVVHFPEYTGLPLLDGLPRTWVPVPCVEVRNKQTSRYVRVGLPLRLAHALTIHKAQGLSLPEGAVVDLQVSNPRRSPVGSMGLAFVAWTLVTTWQRIL